MKETDNDNLAQLFRKLPTEELPSELKIYIIESAAVKGQCRRLSPDTKGVIAATVVSIVLIAGVLFLFRQTLPPISISLPAYYLKMADTGRYTLIITVALLSLVLLVIETLISRRMVRKRMEEI